MVVDIRRYLTMKESPQKNSGGLKKFTVTEVREKRNGFVNPVLVSFQNGTLNDGKSSGFKVNLTAGKNGETNVEIETPYGHVFKESNPSDIPKPKQIIAIRNRKTNKVKVVEIDSAVLINSALITKPVTQEAEVNYSRDMKTLNKTFGGKKIVSRLEQRDKLNISSMPIADEVKKAVEEIKVEDSNTSLNETETESILHLLPPCHRDATAVSDVYVMNEMFTEEELEELKNEVNRLKEVKYNPADYSEYYAQCYTEAMATKGNLDTRLAGILFTEVLIKFLKMPSKKLTGKKVVFCEFSSIIHNKLLNEFCIKTETSVSRPMSMRDKGLCYVMAVSLISCSNKVNLKLLSKCTAVNLARLTRLARAVGLVPLSKDNSMFVLKLPLPALPKTTTPKRGRKK